MHVDKKLTFPLTNIFGDLYMSIDLSHFKVTPQNCVVYHNLLNHFLLNGQFRYILLFQRVL